MTLRKRMWEEDVAKLLAAIAGSVGVRGTEDYEVPSEKLARLLQPADELAERRQRAIAAGGDVVES